MIIKNMNFKIDQLINKFYKIPRPIKLFSLLLLSAIIVHISFWALDWKYGELIYYQSKEVVTYSDLLSPAKDGGYLEYFEYILLIWCFILSALWVFINKFFKAIVIPFVYIYLFLDNCLVLHEHIGYQIKLNLFIKYNILVNQDIIRIQDISELIYWLLIAIPIIFFSISFLRDKNKEKRSFVITNLLLFFGMGFFGIICDFIGAIWYNFFYINNSLFFVVFNAFIISIEEIGEILIIAIACVWLFYLNFNYKI